MSSGAFPTAARSHEPSGGTLMINVDGGGCEVCVSFAFPKGNGYGDLPDRIGERFYLRYGVRTLNATAIHGRVLQEVQELVFREDYCRCGRAFGDDLDLKVALLPFAHVGCQLFTDLFGLGMVGLENHFESDLPGEDLQPYGECLRTWLRTTPSLTLVINQGRRGYLPWNIFYHGLPPTVASEVEPTSFWGFGKQVQIMSDGLCDHLDVRPVCHVSAGVEKSDDRVRSGTLVHEEGTHPFKTLPSGRLFVSTCLDEVLTDFGNSDLFYFFGHASGSASGHEFATISLNGDHLAAPDLRTRVAYGRVQLPANRPVLVFLNGCNTQVGNGKDTIADVLIQLKRRGFCFVSTIATVPAWAGARFASEFLTRFLAGIPLGQAMMEARHEMLTGHRSPIGLFYAAY